MLCIATSGTALPARCRKSFAYTLSATKFWPFESGVLKPLAAHHGITVEELIDKLSL